MVRRDKITMQEAGMILRLFDEGKLKDRDLALALELSAAALLTPTLAREAARNSIAGRVLLERISYDGRRKLTIRLLDEFNDNVFGAVRSFTSGKSGAAALHEALLKEITDDILREATLGAGRELLPSEIRVLRPRIDEQAAYLQRFMDEVAFKKAAGNPMSEKAINARAKMYKGPGRQAFYEYGEAGFGPDYVFDYISMDDGGVCKPCLDAEAESPYLAGQGIFPTQVCLGRGKCRCVREPRFAPDEARRLRGE